MYDVSSDDISCYYTTSSEYLYDDTDRQSTPFGALLNYGNYLYTQTHQAFCDSIYCPNMSIYVINCTGLAAYEPKCTFRVYIDHGPQTESRCVKWE